MNYFVIFPILSALMCAGLGSLILSRNPRHITNISFAAGMGSLIAIAIGNALLLLSGSSIHFRETALPGMRIYIAGQIFMPAAWIVFSTVFARTNYKEMLLRWRYALAVVCATSVIFILFIGSHEFLELHSVMDFSGGRTVDERLHIISIGAIGRYFYIYQIIGLMLSLIQLENTFRSSKDPDRQHIKYVIFGSGAILAFSIYSASQALLFSSIDINAILITPPVILISVSMIALSIVKHRLMEVDIYVSRSVVYNSATILAVGAYLIAVGLITSGIRYFQIPFTGFFITMFIFIAFLGLISLLFITKLRRKGELFISRHFYKHKYDFRGKWMETVAKISPKNNVKDVADTLIEMLRETIGAESISLWLYEPVSGKYRVFPGYHDNAMISADHPVIQRIRKEMSPHYAENHELDKTLQSNTKNNNSAVLCAPLIADQDVIGFILLGKDISGEPYGHNDYELLNAVTTQAAMQIKNIRLTQDVTNAKEVEAFHRLSTFIMHDIKNLTNSLSLVSQNARHNMNNPEFQSDAIKTIDITVERMKKVINRLSTASKSLHINKVKTDVRGLIQNLLNNTAFTENKNIKIEADLTVMPVINIDQDAIEMVLMNLLVNACDAVKTKEHGKITIRSSVRNPCIDIYISDDGIGMSREFIEKNLFKPFKTTKKNGLGIGLFQCKSMVEAHGGNIEVDSAPGQGTTFKVSLPLP